MDDLAAFLELVHTAGSRWRSLSATVETTMDLAIARTAWGATLARSNVPMPPPFPSGHDVPTGVERRTFELSARGLDRVRIEQTGEQHTVAMVRPDGTATQGPDGEWSFQPSPEQGVVLRSMVVGGPRGGNQSFGMVTMVDPSPLLGACRFRAASPVVIDGRPALHGVGVLSLGTMGFGPGPADLHPGCSTAEVTVDVATGVLLRFDEVASNGVITARSLTIVAVDEPIEPATFELPAHVEATTEARSIERFDSPRHLAAHVEFSVYELHPAPIGGMVLCMRQSVSIARISYMPLMVSLPQPGAPMSQPTVVRSGPPSDDTPGVPWRPVQVQGRPAWVWTAPNGDGYRSHVRISFDDGSVEVTCDFDEFEALRLADTLRKVQVA